MILGQFSNFGWAIEVTCAFADDRVESFRDGREFKEGEVVNLLDFESGEEKRRGFKQSGHGRSPQLEVIFLSYKADGQRLTGGHRNSL